MMKMYCSSVCVCVLLLLVPLCVSHPQCLDYLPPFESEASYCSEYSEFGCCSLHQDQRTSRRSERLLSATRAGSQVGPDCEDYLRNVSCTSCSPYAAHLFDVEGSGRGRDFPWLCRDYCQQAYQHCKRVLLRYFHLRTHDFELRRNPRTYEALVEDSIKFCEAVIPSESPYCYPQVLTGPQVPDPVSDNGDLGCLCALPVASGLRNPLFAVHSGDGTGRLFIGEQLGLVWVLTANNTRLSTPFLDISSKVLTSSRQGDERGLLGMAFHPNYTHNRLFYLYYSTTINGQHWSRVSEFSASTSNGDIAEPSSEREVLRLRQPRGNHNGGQLLFKEGHLLIFLGDGGGAGDAFGTIGNGQNKATWLGSVLRVDVNGRDPDKQYAVPTDNPFVGQSNAAPEVYAYGLRNPWRCSVDRGDPDSGEGKGRVFCGDVGQNRFEEIDIIERGGNYGWRAYEGTTCFDQTLCESSGNMIGPIDVYDHQTVGVSVTGGYVYRGCHFPNLRGLYIYGDYGTGTLLSLRETASGWVRSRLCMGGDSVCTGQLVGTQRQQYITSFGEDQDGELYLLTTSNASPTQAVGTVYQLIDPSRRARPSQCKGNFKELKYQG